MYKWLKKHFVPHSGNNHRPHFLHGPNSRKIVLAVVAVELALFILPSILFFKGFDFAAAVLPGALASLTNEQRSAYNLNQLTVSPELTRAAELKVADMTTKGYFAHNSPEGLTSWYWLGLVGYKYIVAGENLAVNFNESREVVEAWMNSPTHRANVLRQGFTEVGSAVAVGMYQGRQTVYAVQYYASPASLLPATVPAKTTPKPTPITASAPTASAPTVLGEETSVPSETETKTTAPSTAPERMMKAVVENVEKTATSPGRTTNIALATILSFVALALVVNSLTGVHKWHPDLLTNGLVVAALILGVYLANNYLFITNPTVPQEASVIVSEIVF